MKRLRNIRTVYSMVDDTYDIKGIWLDVFGKIAVAGLWIIYGAEKNGKTWFALKLADYLSKFAKVLYISAEEGMDKDFRNAMKRAKLEPNNESLYFWDYTSLDEVSERLSSRGAPRIVFIDNVTIYKDELAYGGFKTFTKAHPNHLIIFVAHEERNEPYTATAKMIKRLSKIIVRVQGLACFISGRCPGGTLTIDEEKAVLYHGTEITKS